MKGTDGKSQRREEKRRRKKKENQKEKRREEERRSKRESLRRKRIQVREKVGKPHRKVGSLKRRVRSQLARWEMKKCTPLWREAHFQVKMYKAHQVWSTVRSCYIEKVHALVAQSTFPSQNVQNSPSSDHFWKLRCRKSARRCGAKHMSKSKCTKHTRFGPLLEVEIPKKCTPLWHVEVKSVKSCGVRSTFGRSDVVPRGRRKGLWTLSKVSKTWGFCSISKNDGRRGTFEEDLQRCIFRGRRSTRDIFIKDVLLEVRALISWGIVSQNWGSLAELFRFSCCQLQKIRKSRRIVSFLMLSSSKIEEISPNCFVFHVVKFKDWGSLAELLPFQACR